MKNFLKICRDVIEEAGLSGEGPVTVTNTTGIERRVVGWVRQSWLDIQRYRSDWPWMRKYFSFTTSPGKVRYTLAELGLSDLETWIFDAPSAFKVSLGPAAEVPIGTTTYDQYWRHLRINNVVPAPPAKILEDPVDHALIIHPIPDGEYQVTILYYRTPQELNADTDIPIIPVGPSWQEIIKWKALMYYAYHDGAPDLSDEASQQYLDMIHALDNRFGQQISFSSRPIA